MISLYSTEKYIQEILYRQILNPDCVVSSRYSIPETLSQLGVSTVDAEGNDIWLMGIYNELTIIINKMEDNEYEYIK